MKTKKAASARERVRGDDEDQYSETLLLLPLRRFSYVSVGMLRMWSHGAT